MPHSLAVRGEDIYFVSKQADMDENKYKSDLFVLKGGETRRLTSSGDVSGYSLLPSGVVFPSLRLKKDRETAEKGVPLTVFQRLPYDGGEAEEFLRLPYSVESVKFIDEERFFFTASYSFEFEAAKADCGGDAEKAAAKLKEDADYHVLDELPFWLNGAGFINKTRSHLYFYDRGKIKSLTKNPEASVGSLSLSDDGTRLCYITWSFTDVQPICDALMELDTATLRARKISVAPKAAHYWAQPLPDGRVLAQACVSEKYGLNENAKLFIRENGAWRRLCGDGGHGFYNSVGSDVKAEGTFFPGCFALCADGGAYLADTQDDSTCIVRVDLASGETVRVTSGSGCIVSADFYGNGFAVIALRANGGSEIYAVGADGGETRLTALNTALCAEYAYSAPVPVSITGERGNAVNGWVIPPVGAKAGKKYPAVLDIHGGPKTVYGSCYFHEMQLWASRGWAVIFCNPNGSDGRGDDFADIRGDYGGMCFRDLMAFTDAAIERFGFIDPERLGVTGGSYGGYMTNWVIGHTGRFKAAASQRSISNWTSFHNTSDIGWYFCADQAGGTPWNGLEKIWEQSPLKYADRVTTPTLFIHSEEDYRCPLSEGVQMFTALRQFGVPARLCMFKGENHELSRSGKPAHRVRRLKEITEWFEKYIGD